MPMNHLDLVAAAKTELLARGEPQDSNRFPFLMVLLVAWATRHEGAKLVGKTDAQNGYTFRGVRYSHDVIAYPDSWIDCVVNAGPPSNVNAPAWNPTGTSPGLLYYPIDPATVWEPTDPIPPIPAPPPVDLGPLLAHLDALEDRLKVRIDGLEQRIQAHENTPPPVCPPLPDYIGTVRIFGYPITVRSKPVM